MRTLDLALRFAFFAIVPFVATFVSALFPMTPVLVNVALTLIVFAAAEAVRERAQSSPLLARFVQRRLAFEAYYREHPPKPLLFYILYPLLLPYLLARAELRRELWLYRGYTGLGGAVLLIGAGIDYRRSWQPELPFGVFARTWVLLLVIQTLCIFVFLMPAATTVVKLHLERRLPALWTLLGVAALSVALALALLLHRHAHVVSWVTRQRVALRTEAAPEAAKAAQRRALEAAWDNFAELRESTDAQGWVEDDALDRAEQHLGLFYKPDEAYAFTMHALPAGAPEVLVLQCRLGRGRTPIWRAMRRSGHELSSPAELPKGVLDLERSAPRRPPTKRAPPTLQSQ
jgi:hypothetical protein